MKNTFKKITALTLSALTLGTLASCSKKKSENIIDSQESSASAQETESTEKKKLTVAVTEHNSDMSDRIRWFNTSHENIELELINYHVNTNDESYYDDAFTMLKADMISGNTPDIVAIPSDEMYVFVTNSYLADLYPLMDASNGIKREDILPNVLEGLEYKDVLPAICSDFYIMTAVAKSSNISIPEGGFTLDKAAELYNSIPKDCDMLYKMWEGSDFSDGNTLETFIMRKIIRDCVDYENSACNFGDTFRKAIEFLKGKDFLATNLAADPNNEISAEQWSLINDKTFINCTAITGMNAYLSQEVCGIFGGEDITYVGYPSENGSGAITETVIMYGILDDCKYKKEAWEFISYQLDSAQNIPVLTEKLEKQAESTKTDGFALRKPHSLPYPENNTTVTISDEIVQKTLDYIKNIEFNPYYDTQVNNIIREEYMAVLNGEQSIDECVEILESRISIYLSERS